ncbi:hypothetical protein CIK05_11730 [Bdellovibrio sp. qaytius]|nr:hypothetical protein CIK05_11730 [Bdellovibrio sp. qaytius]
MADLKCTTNIPEVQDLKSQELTVGRHFFLSCEGHFDKTFDFTKAQFLTDEKSKFISKLFKAEARSTESFEVDMTLYTAGKVQFPDMIITDGTLQISLGAQNFEVTSVLPKPDPTKQPKNGEQQEQPKPFGYAVSSLHWPMAYTLIFAALVLAMVIQAILLAARSQRWKQLTEVVKAYDSAQAADNQFYKTIRELEKKDYPIVEIEKAAKVYILRRFSVPIFNLDLKETISFIKKRHPQLKEQRRQVYNIVKDIELLAKDPNVTTVQKTKFISRFYEFISKCEATAKAGGFTK